MIEEIIDRTTGKKIYWCKDIKVDVYLTSEQMEKLESASRLYSLQRPDSDAFTVEKLIENAVILGLNNHIDSTINYMDVNSRGTYEKWFSEQCEKPIRLRME